jgi:hypothetical protein
MTRQVLFEVAGCALKRSIRSRRRLPELTDNLGQFVRTFLREKVTAVWTDRGALHVVSGRSNSRAWRIAHPVGSAERQNGHNSFVVLLHSK